MLAAEGLMLSLTACLAAWLLTLWGTRAIGMLAPPLESGLHMQFDLAPDGRVLVYAMALTVFATLVFTLASAPGVWQRQILPLLKGSEYSVIRGGSRSVNALVVTQVALCAMLVTAGSLAYQSVFYIDRSDLYFTKDRLLLANINTAGAAAEGNKISLSWNASGNACAPFLAWNPSPTPPPRPRMTTGGWTCPCKL